MPSSSSSSTSTQPSFITAPRQLLSSLAPQLMSNRILTNSNSTFSTSSLINRTTTTTTTTNNNSTPTTPPIDLTKLLRLLLPPALGGRAGGLQLNDLLITDPSQINQLLALELPPPPSQAHQSSSPSPPSPADLSLIDGFQATLPSSLQSKLNRRRRRAEIGHRILGLDHPDHPNPISLHLKDKLDAERGLIQLENKGHRRKSSTGYADRPQNPNKRPTRRRKTDHTMIGLSKAQPQPQPLPLPSSSSSSPQNLTEIKEMIPELKLELDQIVQDRENLQIRKELISKDLNEIDLKIIKLNQLKEDLERSMLSLREEELELIDEYEGVNDRLIELQQSLPLPLPLPAQPNHGLTLPTATREPRISPTNSRRRRGPAFLPSEHDELPKNVSFMTLRAHSQAILALDFSSPYGYLVSSSLDESLQLWDLATGEPIRSLNGHNGIVKCLQVEEMTCITGGIDGQIRIWDLDRALEMDSRLEATLTQEERILRNDTAGVSPTDDSQHDTSRTDPCVMKLEGHSRSVTALYFDDTCLVTGSSDKTIRQWDLNTGQAVMTMDILWAMQNPPLPTTKLSSGRQFRNPSSTISDFEFGPSSHVPSVSSWSDRSGRPTLSSNYVPGDDSVEESKLIDTVNQFDTLSLGHEDYIGGIQFWGYALASGSGDGCVRMWDMRTGQAHRTLVGHTGPITCLQFDEIHLVSGSTDKSIKIWDLRTGAVTETIKYSHPITALQFDSRKIMCAAGDTNINVYNRTTLQRSTISLNGHTDTVERLRYFDRYMVTGSKDNTIKAWSI
ncbi:Mitochondrial fission protein [Puccinia graminis f. sp. tritici]|uniref:Mitochondrial fission protein n=1 Tax=Puccinia graminis f. sp. tritici TaxID=56615 RepID=A0A5B0M8I7_PUCGR|nr:Mitochondrial fission protein [Puccinia graminis f. sp. tritici]KAA1120276.1 Mitochondrial fission protein [Puccinia graminis f. sp. tritici]